MPGDSASALLFDPDDGAGGRPTWMGDLAFVGAVAALFVLLVVEVAPELLQGALLDTDSYMRLVRVRNLAESGAWYDGTIVRSNAPFGETLHWTRVVDVLVLLGGWLLTPVLGFERALHASGVFLSPLLLVATCLAVAWTLTPLVGPGMRYYAMIGVLAQVGIMSYALPGRVDHHMLIVLVFVILCGFTVRMLLGAADARTGLATGIWAGLGVWVSTEFLLAFAALLGATAILWIIAAEDRARRFFWLAVGFGVSTATALLLERPPGDLGAVEFDRISVVHGWLALVAAVFWAAVLRWERGERPPPSDPPDERRGAGPAVRASVAGVGAVIAVALTHWLFPGFFAGPMADVDPELLVVWLPHLTEYQPFLVPNEVADVGRIVAYLGPALLAVPVLAWWLARDRDAPLAPVWVFVLVGLAAFTPLSIRWVRFVPYAEVLGLIVLIVIMESALRRVDASTRGFTRTLARVGVSAGLLAGFLLGGGALMATGGQTGDAARDLAETQIAACSSGPMMEALSDPDGLGAEPRTIVAHVDLGPEILYRTPHSVLATPYHRNASGLLTGRRILASRDEELSRALSAERGVDLMLVCGAGTAAPFFGGTEPPITLYGRLVTGDPPPWLTAHPVAEASSGGFLLYRVVSGG